MGRFEDDLDLSTARAWSQFQARLADHVVEMEDDDLLVIEALSGVDNDGMDGAAPYIQFCAYGEDLVRCEVSSNQYLAAEHCLSQVESERLTELGWCAPTCSRHDENPGQGSANFYVDLERNQGDRLAVMTVTAFRDVFGVKHPAFLDADKLRAPEPPAEPTIESTRAAQDPPVDPSWCEPLAVMPRDHDHLQRLVGTALGPLLGYAPDRDEDGDIPIVDGKKCVFVRVHETALVEVYAVVLLGIEDRARAAFETFELNLANKLVKFVLLDDAIVATFHVPAWPFAPEHLRSLVGLMMSTLDSLDDDLAARVRGSWPHVADSSDEEEWDENEAEPDGSDDDHGPVHPAMQTLRELEAEAPGSVDPELAADICEMDRDLILELIRHHSEQELRWRGARDEAIAAGDPEDEAASCDGEMLRAIRMQSLLRRALRVVVEQRMGRPPGRTSYDEPPHRPGAQRRLPPRRRREPADPTLEEVDPDAWN
ncbi:MAG TPA: hypothetical protein VLB29_07125 [Nocardioidaceae bacterium]|nr:hypothetical protein [Nocardioidaceae bacterium]